MRSYFLALKLGKQQMAFGKKCATNLSLKFGVQIAVEIEQQFFVHRRFFAWRKKLGDINPMCDEGLKVESK
jgi:hypothetical protein